MADEDMPALTEVSFDGLDRRLRVFRAGNEVDTCVVVTERYVVVMDTMATPELAAGIVERVHDVLDGRLLLVVNTHADWDHCWGNALFAAPGGRYPAPIIGHELSRQRLCSAQAQEFLQERRHAEPRFADVRLVPPTITFRESLRIDGGDLTLQLIPTPGHSEDHISVWLPELRVVLAGDAAESPIPYIEGPATLPALRSSLALLAALDPAVVIPCHGDTTDPALLARNSAPLLSWLRGRSAQEASACWTSRFSPGCGRLLMAKRMSK